MNQDIKKKWIAALRSGKYKQAQKVLRAGEDRFCCLGVLCDVVDSSRWDGNAYHDDCGRGRESITLPDSIGEIMDLDDSASFDAESLPKDLRERLGKATATTAKIATLTWLNDAGASFDLIADVIEADPHWYGLEGYDEDEEGEAQ